MKPAVIPYGLVGYRGKDLRTMLKQQDEEFFSFSLLPQLFPEAASWNILPKAFPSVWSFLVTAKIFRCRV